MRTSFYLVALLTPILWACEKDADSTPPLDPDLNRQEIITSLLSSFQSSDTSAIQMHIHPTDFIQHNLDITDGLSGMKKAVLDGPFRAAEVNTVRMWEDDGHIITHNEINVDGNAIVGFNIFRFEADKIVEHWDNRQPMSAPNGSGHTMIDGPTEIVDLDKTQDNKLIVTNFLEDILIGGQYDMLSNYFADNHYIQHNPNMQDSVSTLEKMLANMDEQGAPFYYTNVHKVLGQGNFVLAISEGTFNGTPAAFYDIFRLENDKLAEHWDVIQEIPPENTWANANGKF